VQHLKQAPRIALFIAVEQRPFGIPTIERFRQWLGLANLRRIEALGLLGSLTRDRAQPIEPHGFGDGALGDHRFDAAHAKFGGLLHDQVSGVTFHRREHEVEIGNRARGPDAIANARARAALADRRDRGAPFPVLGIERAEPVADREAQNRYQVARLRLVEVEFDAWAKSLIDQHAWFRHVRDVAPSPRFAQA
jgi:hypothetical protein